MGRARLDTVATVHLGSTELVCTTRDLSVKGIALTRAAKAPTGSFLRILLRLPGSSRPIDLDGVLVRVKEEGGGTTWGLTFHEPPRHVTEALASYVATNRCDGPFSRSIGRQHEVRLHADAASVEPAAVEPMAAEPEEPALAVPEGEEQPEQSMDQQLQDLYERAVDKPRQATRRGLWRRFSYRSES